MTNEKNPWMLYKRVGEIEARPWTEDDMRINNCDKAVRPVSVSGADLYSAFAAMPPQGFVARNPANHADQWYIAPDYFAKNYSPAPTAPGESASTPVPWSYVYEHPSIYRDGSVWCREEYRNGNNSKRSMPLYWGDDVKVLIAERDALREQLAGVRNALRICYEQANEAMYAEYAGPHIGLIQDTCKAAIAALPASADEGAK